MEYTKITIEINDPEKGYQKMVYTADNLEMSQQRDVIKTIDRIGSSKMGFKPGKSVMLIEIVAPTYVPDESTPTPTLKEAFSGCVASRTLTEEEIRNSRIDIPGAIAADLGKKVKEEASKMKGPPPPPLHQMAVWVGTGTENGEVQDRYFALGKRWGPGKDGLKRSVLCQCFISIEAGKYMRWNSINEWGEMRTPKTTMSAQEFLAQYPPTTQEEKIKYCKICKLPVDEGGLGDACSRCLPIVQGVDKACVKHITDCKEKRAFLPSDKEIEELLRELINGNNLENLCNTPDFILAQYMARCLKALEDAVNARDEFYSLHPDPWMRPVNTVGSTPEFGPSPLEAVLKDALHFDNVRKAVEEKAVSAIMTDKERETSEDERRPPPLPLIDPRNLTGMVLGKWEIVSVEIVGCYATLRLKNTETGKVGEIRETFDIWREQGITALIAEMEDRLTKEGQ